MKLGPIGVAGAFDQLVPPCDDHIQASAKRHQRRRLSDQHGALSMRFAEHGREGYDEDLIAEIIADVQDPATPIFPAGCHNERPHNESGMVMRCNQIIHGGAASINQHSLGVGAMEIDLSHIPPPIRKIEVHAALIAARLSAENSDGFPKERYGVRGPQKNNGHY
jgi:hypothetical protein